MASTFDDLKTVLETDSTYTYHNFSLDQSMLCDSSNSQSNMQTHLQSEEQDHSTSRRTENIINELDTQLDCFIKTKQLLLDQFADERQSLKEKYGQIISGMRQKHYACEESFKSQLANLNAKYQELEDKLSSEQTSFKQQLNRFEVQLAEANKQAKSDKENLEFVIDEKKKTINDLTEEKIKIENHYKVERTEFKNRRQQLEEEIRQYKSNQEKDFVEIKKLKDDLITSNKKITHLQNELKDLSEHHKQLEENYNHLSDESNKVKGQLELEAKAKQEKIDTIHSLTVMLNESKSEIENLQKNFTELETKRSNEIKDMEIQMTERHSSYEQQLNELRDEKSLNERNYKQLNLELERNVWKYQTECDNLKTNLEQKLSDFESEKQQFETQIQNYKTEKETMERSYNSTLVTLNQRIEDLERKLAECSVKYEQCQIELNKTKNLLTNAETELKIHKSEQLAASEKYNLLELDRSSISAEVDNYKRLLQAELAEKKEKMRTIQSLSDSLSTSHYDIEKLKDANEQMQRSLREADELRQSLHNDCNELRATLAEVEKSRIDIKSKLNSSQFTCVSAENRLKIMDSEIHDLNLKNNAFVEEKKMLQESLESASKSLTQMKLLNERLHEQNVDLQNRVSQLETERLQSDRKMSSTTTNFSDKENELKRLKRECDQLRERNIRLDNEKRRFERSYVNLEREYSTLKSSTKSSLNLGRSPSPAGVEQPRLASGDQSSRSLLSLTNLLSETNFLNPNVSSAKRDIIFDETLNITRSLEALNQKNNELQKKVLGLQNMMDAASSESNQNTNTNLEDFSEFRMNESSKLETIYSDSNNNNNEGDNFEERNISDDNDNNSDFGGNKSINDKLRLAQKKAQTLIDSSSLYGDEITIKPIGSKSSHGNYRKHSLFDNDNVGQSSNRISSSNGKRSSISKESS